MSVKFLCVGDVHLGRSSSRVPSVLAETEDFSLRSTLAGLASLAESQEVSAVFFTGDIADVSNAYFEAFSALRPLIDQLSSRGIPVFSVAGNHDYRLLNALAKELPGLKVLGADGCWEATTFKSKDDSSVRVVGRSFTDRYFSGDFLDGLPVFTDRIPTVGLLHCDVDVPQSDYGPVSLKDLQSVDGVSWVLGHIHKPTVYQHDPPIFYPGTLQGLDPGERGAHGAWTFEHCSGSFSRLTQHKIAPVRYERLEISFEGVEANEEIRPILHRAVREWHDAHQNSLEHCRLVLLRAVCVGRSEIGSKLRRFALDLDNIDPVEEGSVSYAFESIEVETQRVHSLESISQYNDLPGVLATRIIALRDSMESASVVEFLEEITAQLQPHLNNPNFAAIDKSSFADPDALRSELIKTGVVLLEELLAQDGGE